MSGHPSVSIILYRHTAPVTKVSHRYISLTPPAILPAKKFMNRYLSLLSAYNPAFITSNLTAPESSTSTPFEVSLTVSPSLNFLQLAILTVQRAPAEGVSGVQARGTTGGVGKEWESLVRRYKGMGPLLNDEAVQEVGTSICGI